MPTNTDRLSLTAKTLRRFLRYQRRSGDFIWLVTTGSARAGDIAGHVNISSGYRHIGLRGFVYTAARLAVLHVTGAWPASVVDHRNGRKADNRWRNLRTCTPSQNRANSALSPLNTTGYQGVVRIGTRYRASVVNMGHANYYGSFSTAAKAGAAAAAGRAQLFGAFAPTTNFSRLAA